jgi:hypothetical protein
MVGGGGGVSRYLEEYKKIVDKYGFATEQNIVKIIR